MTPEEQEIAAAALEMTYLDEVPGRLRKAILDYRKKQLTAKNPEWEEQLHRKHYERWTSKYRYEMARKEVEASIGSDALEVLEAGWRKQGEQ